MSDLSPTWKLRTLRGKSWLSAREFGGLMTGAHSLDTSLPLPAELTSALDLREQLRAASVYDPATHPALISELEQLNQNGEWVQEYLSEFPKEEFSALARTTICLTGLQATYAPGISDERAGIMAGWTTLLSHLLTSEWSETLITELGFGPDFASDARRLIWPQSHTDELIFGSAPPQLRRWHQRLHSMERLNLVSMTLYAERSEAPQGDWGGIGTPDDTPAGLLGRFMALTRLQRSLPSPEAPRPRMLSGPEFQREARPLTDMRLPAPGTPHRHSDLLLSVLITMVTVPAITPNLARSTTQLLKGGFQVMNDLRGTLWAMNSAIPAGSDDPWHAALQRLREHWNAIDG